MLCKSLFIKAIKIKCSFFSYKVEGRGFFVRSSPCGGGGGLGNVGTSNIQKLFTPVHICPPRSLARTPHQGTKNIPELLFALVLELRAKRNGPGRAADDCRRTS